MQQAKDKTQHMILVGIHAVVMTIFMYGVYLFLIKDKECPKPKACPPPKACPSPKKCLKCDDSPQGDTPQGDTLPQPKTQPPAQQSGSGTIEGFSF